MKNGPFLKIPVCLLKIPAYGRFDGSGVGHMYRVLAANICRKGSEDMARSTYYTGEGSPLAALAELYDRGILAAYYSDERLSKMLGVGRRSIQLYRAKLKKLGLIRISRLHGGYIYELGQDGSLYIDAWPELAERHPEEFSAKLVQALAARKLRDTVEDFFSRGKRKEVREKTKNTSSKKGGKVGQQDYAGQEKSQQNLFDIIDNNIIDNKNMLAKDGKHEVGSGRGTHTTTAAAWGLKMEEATAEAANGATKSAPESTQGTNASLVSTDDNSAGPSQGDASSPGHPQVDGETLKRIKLLAWRAQNPDISDFDAISLVREAQQLGLPHWEAKRLLTVRVKRQGYRYFDALPRFSLTYHNLVSAKDQGQASQGSQANVLFRLCLAIREDWTGRYLDSNNQHAWRAGIAITKHLLDKYPYEQVIWSLTKAAAYRDFVEGLSKTEKYLHAVADAYAADYQEWKGYCRQRELEAERLAREREEREREEKAWQQELEKEREEHRRKPTSDLDIWFEGIMQQVEWRREFLRARKSLLSKYTDQTG